MVTESIVPATPKPFVVAGPLCNAREYPCHMRPGVAVPSGFRGISGQLLRHGQTELSGRVPAGLASARPVPWRVIMKDTGGKKDIEYPVQP